ncbi:MAG: hypothetical protein J5910_01540 [Lachnospiraceae bacterium]|nr:hypothetical protein [Lachnospiraceae bacterium]
MNTKRIPAFVMLLAGAVATIVTYINHYNLEDMLVVLILTLIVFLIIGVAIKLVFDSFHIEQPDEDRVDDDGEVVEKTEESANTEGSETDASAAAADEGMAAATAEGGTGAES